MIFHTLQKNRRGVIQENILTLQCVLRYKDKLLKSSEIALLSNTEQSGHFLLTVTQTHTLRPARTCPVTHTQSLPGMCSRLFQILGNWISSMCGRLPELGESWGVYQRKETDSPEEPPVTVHKQNISCSSSAAAMFSFYNLCNTQLYNNMLIIKLNWRVQVDVFLHSSISPSWCTGSTRVGEPLQRPSWGKASQVEPETGPIGTSIK